MAQQIQSQQQTQPNIAQTQTIQQPVAQTTQPVAGQTQQGEVQKTPIWKKWWFWLIVALVIIGAGIGIYFGFFYNPSK